MPHHALADALSTAQVFIALASRLDTIEPQTVGSLVAAGSVVGENARIPPGVLAAGAPAKVKKALEGEAARWIDISAREYVALSRSYMEEGVDSRIP